MSKGSWTEAVESYQKLIAVCQRLADSDPSNADWQRNLSVGLEKVGDVRAGQGDSAGALTAYQESLTIRETLAASDPSNAEWQRDVAVSYSKLATIAEQTNDPQANEWWQKCVAVFDRMVAAGLHVSPGDLGFLKQLRAKLSGARPTGGGGGSAGGWKSKKAK